MNDGPNVNLWDALAVGMWLLATGLIVYDTFTSGGDGMGPRTPFGGLAALAATVLTIAGIARRAKEEVMSEIHRAVEMHGDSVRVLRR